MAQYYDPEDRAISTGTNEATVIEWQGRNIAAFGRSGYYPSRKDIDYTWNPATAKLTLLQPGDTFDGSSFHAEFGVDLDTLQTSGVDMTNIEALAASIGIPGYNELSLYKALKDSGLDPNAVYDISNKTAVDQATLVVLKSMLGLRSIQEGGYQIVLAIQERIDDLKQTLGISTVTITNASYFW